MSFFPDNTVAEFTTKLPEPINLDGEYEVALVELIFPHSFYNVHAFDGFFVEAHMDGANLSKYREPSGYFDTEEDFLEHLTMNTNNKFHSNPELTETNITFGLNQRTRRVVLTVDGPAWVYLTLSQELRELFGLTDWYYFRSGSVYNGTKVLDINGGNRLMYIYCDIASYSAVGNTKSPLLRVCDVSGKPGGMNRITFSRPFYTPIARRQFDTIVINIRNELGEAMPFEFGKSVVTLHVRRRHNLLSSSS